ncbi:MAG: nicotinamide mononucleotide transporter [Prevotellaceae bacterium]|jgi:nicotinamide riboside transporter PnuC|nr:nicotinamide mononucleotide transporter [Prevotellaceae bacterium]
MTDIWKSTTKNLLFALCLTSALLAVIHLVKIPIVIDKTMAFSILSTITGVGYILTIRNPENYTGFYFGVISSACLGVQMMLSGNLDQTFLYLAIFVPCQSSSLINWRKKYFTKKGDENFVPQFLKIKTQLIFLLIFIILTIADYVFMSKYLSLYNKEGFFSNFIIKIIFAIMVSSSILANILLIVKRMDCWIYWIIYSGLAVISAVIIKNNFNLLLFIFFLIINSLCFISWLKLRKS